MKQIFTLLAAAAITQAANAQVGIVNVKGNLDVWRTYDVVQVFPPSVTTLDAPDGWYSSDSLVFAYGPLLSSGQTFVQQLTKDAASHAGAFAAKLTTKDQGPDLGELPCLMSNAKMDIDPSTFDPADPLGSLELEGGTAVTERTNVVSAWVKYTPVGTDKAFMVAVAKKAGSEIGTGEFEIAGTAGVYTKVSMRITYLNATDIPDQLQIIFTSSDPDNAPAAGSELFVDDVEAIGASGVSTPLFKNKVVNVYPVPAHGSLNLSTGSNKAMVWEALTMDGKVVAQASFTGNTTVDISNLAAGVYSYRVSGIDGVLVQTGKFNVQ